MFDPDSRYAKRPLKQTTDAAGRTVSYVARRIIREGPGPVAELAVQPGDRLDLIANRAYGEPRLFWRVADANPVPDPDALDRPAGRRLKINQIDPE